MKSIKNAVLLYIVKSRIVGSNGVFVYSVLLRNTKLFLKAIISAYISLPNLQCTKDFIFLLPC